MLGQAEFGWICRQSWVNSDLIRVRKSSSQRRKPLLLPQRYNSVLTKWDPRGSKSGDGGTLYWEKPWRCRLTLREGFGYRPVIIATISLPLRVRRQKKDPQRRGKKDGSAMPLSACLPAARKERDTLASVRLLLPTSVSFAPPGGTVHGLRVTQHRPPPYEIMIC